MSAEYVVTKIHPVSRASTICCSAAMSDGNILQTQKKLIHRLITMDTSTRRRRGLNFAVAGDKKDLSLTEKEVRKRKI